MDPYVRLDYVFASAGQPERLLTCEVVRHPPVDQASDHFPLLTEIDTGCVGRSSGGLKTRPYEDVDEPASPGFLVPGLRPGQPTRDS